MFTLTWVVILFTMILTAMFLAEIRRPKEEKTLTHPVMRVLTWLNLAAMIWCGVYWWTLPR
jgi:quinol-cytochrome oxidoreductase complex cytochrome b subunit